ncbi:RNA polymerase subunit sigma-70 [Streptosporangiaceae bacterium NEAU-GS5]|nr:RNA polymerase subunit sigma-70 [Streptosporangiaceae bacterium NEAU-GS5]
MADLVELARAGDEAAFGELAGRHRRELHVHCYRMLGSFEEAEDLVQETLLRAWRKRDTFEGGPLFRAWLYRIATNACLDFLRSNARKVRPGASFDEMPWMQPYPDLLLDEAEQPEAVAIAKETIELAYLAVIQLLPAKQRAALLLRDVLGWSAAETATILETSVPAANSALQRARATLKDNLPDWSADKPTDNERELLMGFIDAHERADAEAAIAIMREDIRITMPPLPFRYDGITSIARALLKGLREPGEWRLVPTSANRMPTAASYLRAWDDTEFRAFKLDVIRTREGRVAEVTTFGADLFPRFGLPPILQVSR